MNFFKKNRCLLSLIAFFLTSIAQSSEILSSDEDNNQIYQKPLWLKSVDMPEKMKGPINSLLNNSSIHFNQLQKFIINYPWAGQKATVKTELSAQDLLMPHASLFADSYKKICAILELNRSLSHKNHKILVLAGNNNTLEKKLIAQTIASASGRPHYTINCNPEGLDKTFLTGFSGAKTFIGREAPGAIAQAFAATGVCNPVVIIENISKLPKEEFSFLLDALAQDGTRTFYDEVMELNIETSEITFIILVNQDKDIPKKIARKLYERTEYVTIGRHTRDQKIEIVYQHILDNLLKAYALSDLTCASIKRCIPAIIDHSSPNNSGLAETERALSKIITYCAQKSNKIEKDAAFLLTPQDIETIIPKTVEGPGFAIPVEIMKIMQQRLADAPFNSASYIAACKAFPWKPSPKIKFDKVSAIVALNSGIYGLSTQKQRIYGILHTLAQTPAPHKKGICIVGAPGTGKTLLAEVASQALGQPKYVTNMAAAHHTFLNGTPISSSGAEPGVFFSAFCATKTQNPTIILENIDKTVEQQVPVLLSALNPATNTNFTDQFAGFEINTSGAFIIATATDASLISEKLLDHLELIYLDGYSTDQKLFIAQNFLLQAELKNRSLQPSEIEEIKNIIPLLLDRIAPNNKGLHEIKRVISSLVAQQVESLECYGRTLNLSPERVFNFVDQLLTTHHISESENIQAKCNEVIKKLNITPDQFKHIDSHITALKPWRGGNALTLLYMDWIARFPFNTTTQKIPSLKDALEQLNSTHFGLESIKQSIIDFLAGMHFSDKATANKNTKSLCFVGGPGIGKTTFSESIAKALGRPFARIALESVQSLKGGMGEHEMFGDGPGPIGRALCDTKSLNAVILLDEIDKASSRVICQLLELLDPAQNKTFRDSFLGFDLDLSQVIFIASANDQSRIPGPLADRVHIISMEPYSQQERIDIAHNMIIPKIVTEMGFSPEIAALLHELAEPTVKKIVRTEYGVRNLKRFLQAAADKYARMIIEGRPVTSLTIFDILGDLHAELLQTNPANEPATEALIGITNGMYANGSDGGGIMKIEASVIPYGKGKLIKTLLHGDMSLESHSRTLAHIKSLCTKYNINPEIFNTSDFLFSDQTYHKVDGASAGVAQAVALISALTKRAVKPGYAMTGAIDAYGHLLPVGGYRAKILGTERSGIKNILLPECSRGTIEQIRKDFPEINIMYIKTLDEAVQILLEA